MKNKIIVANWKMNGDFLQAESWINSFLDLSNKNLDAFTNVTCVLCPPSILIDESCANILDYVFEKADKELSKDGKKSDDVQQGELESVIDKYRTLKMGAQSCHSEDSGSYTGDVSAKMMAELGCEYVIAGHSERRKYYYETNADVSKKVKAIAGQDITPILCVGESGEVRNSGKHLDFVRKQLSACILPDSVIDNLVVAYEPIWAIGTGEIPTMEQIQEVVNSIKVILDRDFGKNIKSYSILYGGSVNLENSKEILAVDNLDGLLIGKASLNADDFFNICLS